MPVLWNVAIIVSLLVVVPRFDSAEAQLYVYAGGILVGTVIQPVTPMWWLRGRDGRIRAGPRPARPGRQARVHADAAR